MSTKWPDHLHYPDCPWKKWDSLKRSGYFRGSPKPPECTCEKRVTDWLKQSGQMVSRGEPRGTETKCQTCNGTGSVFIERTFLSDQGDAKRKCPECGGGQKP